MAPFLVLLACVLIALLYWKLHNLQDNSKDEPILTEHAKVHAKSEHGGLRGVPSAKYIHFYVPERDAIVICKVTEGIWHYLPKNDWGMLHHQGGKFLSFRRDCDGELVELKDYSTVWDIYSGR